MTHFLKYLIVISASFFIGIYVGMPNEKQPLPIQYINPYDCYVKGYYDGRTAMYGATKQNPLTIYYLDSTFSVDSAKFIQIIY